MYTNLLFMQDMVLFNVKWYAVPTTLRLGCLRSMTVYHQPVIGVSNLLQTSYTCSGFAHPYIIIGQRFLIPYQRKVEPNALCALFGVFPSLPSLSTSKKDVLAFATLLARRLILTNWKSTVSPSHTHLIRDILYFLRLEKIRLLLSGSSNKFGKIWSPLFQFVKRINFPHLKLES